MTAGVAPPAAPSPAVTSPAAASAATPSPVTPPDVRARALASLGTSGAAIYRMAVRELDRRGVRGRCVADVGAGAGLLRDLLDDRFERYVAADVVRYDALPPDVEFRTVDLDTNALPFDDGEVDVVLAVEVIEHLENPRRFLRELTRSVRPGGWVVVTTPNQVSLLSKATLLLKNQFNAFQEGDYPAHITALLPADLRRIAAECGLREVSIAFSERDRLQGTGRHWPGWASRAWPAGLSGNVLMCGRR